jgi:hypothetical protein
MQVREFEFEAVELDAMVRLEIENNMYAGLKLFESDF